MRASHPGPEEANTSLGVHREVFASLWTPRLWQEPRSWWDLCGLTPTDGKRVLKVLHLFYTDLHDSPLFEPLIIFCFTCLIGFQFLTHLCRHSKGFTSFQASLYIKIIIWMIHFAGVHICVSTFCTSNQTFSTDRSAYSWLSAPALWAARRQQRPECRTTCWSWWRTCWWSIRRAWCRRWRTAQQQ